MTVTTTVTTENLVAILPIILTTATSVVVMLCAAFYRNHRLIATLSLFGLTLAAASLYCQTGMPAQQVTPLLLIDSYSRFFSLLILASAAAVTIFSYGYFKDREGLQEEIYVLLLTATLGALVLVSSFHFAGFFLGLELLSVSLFALVAYPTSSLSRSGPMSGNPMEAGIKYLILSGVSSAFLAFGMALIYAACGTMHFAELGTALSDTQLSHYALAGMVILLAGVSFKLSLVPFHMWTPDVYHGAPAPVTAFIATVSKGAVLALLLRSFIALDGYRYEEVIYTITLLAMASMLAGNILALLQTNVKRLLAYSSISHLGYVLVAFLAARSTVSESANEASLLAVEAVAYYIVAYMITTLTAFGIVSLMSSSRSEDESTNDYDAISDYRSLFWRHPFIAAILTASLLSLAGIPLTIGFIGKFYVLAAGVEGALWNLLIVLVISSGIGLFYYLRFIMIMFKGDSEEGTVVTSNAGLLNSAIAIPVGGRCVLAVLGLLLLLLGVYPAPLISIIHDMALSIL